MNIRSSVLSAVLLLTSVPAVLILAAVLIEMLLASLPAQNCRSQHSNNVLWNCAAESERLSDCSP